MGFKAARKRAGLTARELANSVGVSIQTVYNWEAGSYYPDARKLPEIAKTCNCTVDDLLKGGK